MKFPRHLRLRSLEIVRFAILFAPGDEELGQAVLGFLGGQALKEVLDRLLLPRQRLREGVVQVALTRQLMIEGSQLTTVFGLKLANLGLMVTIERIWMWRGEKGKNDTEEIGSKNGRQNFIEN